MDSKEFGLVAAQQLFQIEDLHYGFWDLDEEINLSNWKVAQERHTEFLFNYIKSNIDSKESSKILDIGCGVGVTTSKLLKIVSSARKYISLFAISSFFKIKKYLFISFLVISFKIHFLF